MAAPTGVKDQRVRSIGVPTEGLPPLWVRDAYGLPPELHSVASALRELRRAVQAPTKVVLPVVGSGLSKGLPPWHELVAELLSLLPTPPAAPTASCAPENLLELVEVVEQHAGAPAIAGVIERHFKAPRVPRPTAYDLLVGLPLTQFATTNFDPWIEAALAVAGKSHGPTLVSPLSSPADWDLTRVDSGPFVLYLHGSARQAHTCVLSAGAFQRLEQSPAYRDGVSALIRSRRLLFLGHSFRDPDLVLLFSRWRELLGAEGMAPRHWYLGVGLEPERMRELRAFGIEPIDYRDFGVLPAVLEFLARRDDDLAAAVKDMVDGRYARAQATLEEVGAPLELAGLLWSQGQPEKAWEMLVSDVEQLLAQQPDPGPFLLKLAQAAGDVQGARKVFEAMLDARARGQATGFVIRELSAAEIERLRQDQNHASVLWTRGLLAGQMPWLPPARAPMAEWAARTEPCPALLEQPFVRAAATIYATQGGEPIADPQPGQPMALDMTAMLTLQGLGLLEKAADFAGRLLVPRAYRVALFESTFVLQPDNLAWALALAWLEQNVKDLGEEPPADAFKADQIGDLTQVLCGRIADRDLPEPTSRAPALHPGGAVVARLSLLVDLHTRGWLEPLVAQCRVWLDPDDRFAFHRDLADYRALPQQKSRNDALREKLRALVTAGKVEEVDGAATVPLPLLGADLAQQRRVGLLVDDRAVAAHVMAQSPVGCVATSAALLAAMRRHGRLTRDEHADAVLQMIGWGYRFVVPTPEVLVTLHERHHSGVPCEPLREIARYAHDSLRDPGLVRVSGVSSPAGQCATEWQKLAAQFVAELWADAHRPEAECDRLTRWAAQELAVAPPLVPTPEVDRDVSAFLRSASLALTLLHLAGRFDKARTPRAFAAWCAAAHVSEQDVVDALARLLADEAVPSSQQELFVKGLLATAFPLAGEWSRRNSLVLAEASRGVVVVEPMPADLVDLICNPAHPRRLDTGEGPLLIYRGEGKLPHQPTSTPLDIVLMHQDARARQAVVDTVLAWTAPALAQPTRDMLDQQRGDLLGERWQAAAVACHDALQADCHYHLRGLEQAAELQHQEAIQESWRRLLEPDLRTLQVLLADPALCLAPSTTDFDRELGAIAARAASWGEALAAHDARFASLPLGAAGDWAALLQHWEARHGTTTEVWEATWAWADEQGTLTSTYHACVLFLRLFDRLAPLQVAVLWDRVAAVLAEEPDPRAAGWNLRQTLSLHFVQHAAVQLGSGDGERLACLALRLSDTLARGIDHDANECQRLAQALRENTCQRSTLLHRIGCPPTTFHPWVECLVHHGCSPWQVGLVAALVACPSAWRALPDALLPHVARALASAVVVAPAGPSAWAVALPLDPLRVYAELIARAGGSSAEDELYRVLDGTKTPEVTLREFDRIRRDTPAGLDALLPLASALVAHGNAGSIQPDEALQRLTDARLLADIVKLTDESKFAKWCVLLHRALDLALVRKTLVPHALAALAEGATIESHRHAAFVTAVFASVASRTVSAIGRLRAESGAFLASARQVRTILEHALVFAPPWLAGRIRAVVPSLPLERLSPEEQASARRAQDRGDWRVVKKAQDDDGPAADGEVALSAMWSIAVETWQLAGHKIPGYRRQDAPGRIWRAGDHPPEHAA